MVRAVLWGSASSLLLATLLWVGMVEPRLRRAAGELQYPPVQVRPAASLGNRLASEMPGADAVGSEGFGGSPQQVALIIPGAVAPAAATRPGVTGALLPDLQIRPPADVSVVGSRAAGTLRLKFATTIWNAGDGPVEVRGSQNTEAALQVEQYLHRTSGGPVPDRAVGEFDFDHRHGHLHLGGFARYELWSLDEVGDEVELVAENAKVGFCLMDNLPIDELSAPPEPVYADCDAEVQGISVGYGDIYVAALYEQDLDVSHVPDGRYRLLNLANPDASVRELDYENNSAFVDLVISGGSVALLTP